MNKEIIINKTLTEKDLPYFERARMFKDGNEYIDFLLQLDRRVNGTNDEFLGFESSKELAQKCASLCTEDVEKKIDDVLDDILSCVNYVIKMMPEETRMSSIDGETGLMFIPDDDTLFTSKLLLEEVVELRKILKGRK